ncbi:MAG: HAMP domain-containing histidine kinase [Coriobacteriia bacterium]|nr:HAMP domain-containing histidine kinase [Coriobacteriia bacterium]
MKGRFDLGFRIAAGYAAAAVFTAALAALLLTLTWQQQFERYVREGLQARANDAAVVMAQIHAQAGGWQAVRYLDLGHVGLTMRDFRIQVFDGDGTIIGDSRRSALPQDIEMGGLSRVAGTAATAPIVVNGEKVGEVRVTALSPGGLLTPRDIEFREGSLDSLLVAAIIAVIVAAAAGTLVARGIVRPIHRVTQVAGRLRSGEADARTAMEGPDAVSVLGRTLDEMADSIEADRRFERQLTADVAHELRTPLQAIQATVEAMQDGVLPADEERLGVVRDETVRLARLANSILELSRLESGSTRFECRSLDPADPVRAAVEAHRALLEACSLTLVARLEDGMTIEGDPDRLTQAVGNLLSNAARYTPEGGRVTVAVQRDDDSVRIAVSDTGLGVAEGDRDKVFTRFWRADPARERSKGGVGIGLSVVKEIVERHKGRVTLAPAEENPDGGATFVIRIPLAGGGSGGRPRPEWPRLAGEGKPRVA